MPTTDWRHGIPGQNGSGLQRVYKPGSVFVWSSLWETGYPIPHAVNPKGPRAASTPSVLTLLPMGFTRPMCLHTAGALLPHHFTVAALLRLCHFCGTFRRVAPPGRYPASCPVEPGLSSAANYSDHPTLCAPNIARWQEQRQIDSRGASGFSWLYRTSCSELVQETASALHNSLLPRRSIGVTYEPV